MFKTIDRLFNASILLTGFIVVPFLFCTPKKNQNNPSNPVAGNLWNNPRQDTPDHKPVENKISAEDTLAYIQGHFDPAVHPLFILVPPKYASRQGMYLRKETMEAFIKMSEAAAKEGISLKILSATRHFNAQKKIWEDKWMGRTLVEDGTNLFTTIKDPVSKAKKILLYSSMPGTSRHHWGTDMDLNALSNDYFEHGVGKKIYAWMQAHAATYGFCQPYTAGRPYGYEEEKWHWTYLPVALPLFNYAKKNLSNQALTNFLGHETARTIGVVEKYVLGINESCQ